MKTLTKKTQTSKTQKCNAELPPCEIVDKLRKLDKYQDRINAKIKAKREYYLEMLLRADADAYDWISVAEAAKLRRVSEQAVYSRDDLERKYFGTRFTVRRSQVIAIDDKN